MLKSFHDTKNKIMITRVFYFFRKHLIVGLLAVAFSLVGDGARAAEISPRTTLPLPNWQFALSEAADEPAGQTFDDSTWEAVMLPHTWNAFDSGEKHYHRGTGWYRTHFKLPATAIGQRVLLEFDAASRIADVYVNGHLLGSHIGAFARFRFDATDAVNLSGDNLLAVRVNNATNDFIPRNGDFTVFGGLYRPARVLLTSPAHIATMDHGSPGVFLTAHNVSTNGADVAARIEFANDATQNFTGKIQITVRSPDGVIVASPSTPLEIKSNSALEKTLNFAVSQPHLWNGVADPFVYAATVELLDANGKVVDAVVQPLGLRSFAVKPDAGFFLNGEHVGLHGVNRHQERLDKGWAIDTNDMSEDFRIVQELGANVIRLCHYQHDQFFYSLCDQGGVAVWAELCFVNEPPVTQAGRDNAKEQMRELIRQNYNHPAIFFWSLGNETSGSRTNSAADKLLKELAEVVHEEDPSRLSTYASHHGLTDSRNFRSDILGFNKYFGWYGGEYPELGKFLDQFHADNPQVSVSLSEYGAGASIYQHEENPPVRKDQARGPWHPEESQAKFHEAYWLQLKARPWMWGTFIWCMFDFASAGRAEGDKLGRNDKGLVTADRQTRKDAFYWYQANWATKPMVHINSKDFCDRSQSETELRIYSNAEEVEVKLNGVSLGKTSSQDCRFIWPEIKLKPGVNRIEAVARRAGKPVATDSCGWNYRVNGTLPLDAASDSKDAKGDVK